MESYVRSSFPAPFHHSYFETYLYSCLLLVVDSFLLWEFIFLPFKKLFSSYYWVVFFIPDTNPLICVILSQSVACLFISLMVFLEKEMVTHSSTLAWKIPWMEEPGRLQSMRLQRVGHDWETSLSLSICCHLEFRILFIWQLNKWMFQLPYSCALFKYQQGNAHNTPS